MLHEYQVIYHVIYSFRYYPRYHVTAVGLGTYYQWIRGSASFDSTFKPGTSKCGTSLR